MVAVMRRLARPVLSIVMVCLVLLCAIPAGSGMPAPSPRTSQAAPIATPVLADAASGAPRSTSRLVPGEGFSWINPHPLGMTVNDIAISPAGDRAVLVGSNGGVCLFDGTSCQMVPSDVAASLHGVRWQPGDDRFVAVGDDGTVLRSGPGGDGPLKRLSHLTSLTLRGVVATGTGDQMLVTGEDGGLLRLDGDVLTLLNSTTDSWLRDPATASGIGTILPGHEGTLLRYDPVEGQIESLSPPSGNDIDLRAAVAVDSDTILVVGGSGTLLELGPAGAITDRTGVVSDDLLAIGWDPVNQEALILGEGPSAYRYTLAAGMISLTIPGTQDLASVAIGTGALAGFLVGAAAGELYHYNSSAQQLELLGSGLSQHIEAVAFNSTGSGALVVGTGGALALTDGSALTVLNSTVTETLNDIAIDPISGDALVVGDGGTVLWYNWTNVTLLDASGALTTPGADLTGVAYSADGSVALIVGVGPTVIRYQDGNFSAVAVTPLTEARPLFAVAFDPTTTRALVAGASGLVGDCVPDASSGTILTCDTSGTVSFRTLQAIAFQPGLSDALLVGQAGEALRYSAGVIVNLGKQTVFNLGAVAFRPGDSNPTVAGSGCFVGTLQQHATVRRDVPCSVEVRDVAFASYGLVVGPYGTILRWDLPPMAQPLARISAPVEERTILGGTDVLFDGSQSLAPDGSSLSFEWASDLEGVLGTDPVLEHNLTTPGIQTITLTVRSGTLSDTAEIALTVVEPNYAPVAVISAPLDQAQLSVEEPVQLDGHLSSDPNGDPLHASWFVDTTTFVAAGLVANITVPVGSFTITLWVDDARGEAQSNRSANVTINMFQPNRAPRAVVSAPLEGATFPDGAAVHLDGANSTDADSDLLTYRWLRNGTEEIGSAVSLTRTAGSTSLPAGDHTLLLEVNDGHGGRGTAQVNITVLPPPPPPKQLRLLSPEPEAVLFGQVLVAWLLANTTGPCTAVDLLVDGVPQAVTNTSDLSSVLWDSSATPNGPADLRLRCQVDGVTLEASAEVTLLDRAKEMVVSVTEPLDGAEIVTDRLVIAGTAQHKLSGSTIERVEVRIDGGAWIIATGTTGWSHTWVLEDADEGTHRIEVRSVDQTNATSVPLNLTVSLSLPAPDERGLLDSPMALYGALGLLLGLAVVLAAIVLRRSGQSRQQDDFFKKDRPSDPKRSTGTDSEE